MSYFCLERSNFWYRHGQLGLPCLGVGIVGDPIQYYQRSILSSSQRGHHNHVGWFVRRFVGNHGGGKSCSSSRYRSAWYHQHQLGFLKSMVCRATRSSMDKCLSFFWLVQYRRVGLIKLVFYRYSIWNHLPRRGKDGLALPFQFRLMFCEAWQQKQSQSKQYTKYFSFLL